MVHSKVSKHGEELPGEYQHEYWPDTIQFLNDLDKGLSEFKLPTEIAAIKSVRYPYTMLKSAKSELEVRVDFKNGGKRRFVAVTYEALKCCEQTRNSELDKIYVQGLPTCIVSEVTPLSVFSSIIRYIMFEQDDLADPDVRLALGLKFESDLSNFTHFQPG